MKSLWKAHYDILDAANNASFTIREENPWTKVFDALLGEVPVVGMFTGYMFHPAYLVSRADGTIVLRLEKLPAFLEGKFKIDKQAEMSADEETRALLSLMMMILLERRRG